jgi:triosephosphate isomerase (TIM)
MPDRKPYIAGNWKMHKTRPEAREYVEALRPLVEKNTGVDVGICVPFTALEACVAAVEGSAIRVLAQNMHEERQGAYTGEVSAPMLQDVGVHGVVLGHSERRTYFNETDKALREKLPAALAAGLEPILCVGETEQERENDETERRLRHQVQEAFGDVAADDVARVVIAYEPIWAIGTGRVATPDQAQEAIAFIRALVRDQFAETADSVRVQYGGSVSPDNAAEILGKPDVDGALVGGASLEADSLARIVAAAPQ